MNSTNGLPMVVYLLFAKFWFSMSTIFAISWLAFLLTGRPLIDWLKRLKGMKWSPREDTPDSHLAKSGTPSMGGIGIIGVALLAYLAFVITGYVVALQVSGGGALNGTEIYEFAARTLLFPLCVGLHGLLGFVDDWSKARGKGGLLARQKLAGQIFLAVSFVVLAYFLGKPGIGVGKTTEPWVFAPVMDQYADGVLLVAGFTALVLIIIATSNAVNLTDGIDGLAAGLSVQCGLIFVLLSRETWSGVARQEQVPWLWAALAGACLGFLAFNKYPAKVFMGDTGSLALGAALGAAAVMTGTIFLLPFIGFIFFVEMFSVIGQVAYFKYTKKKFGEGKRIFRRAPLHHHFELGGWSEWRVVLTFWAVNLATSAIGLILWSLGVLPRFP